MPFSNIVVVLLSVCNPSLCLMCLGFLDSLVCFLLKHLHLYFPFYFVGSVVEMDLQSGLNSKIYAQFAYELFT